MLRGHGGFWGQEFGDGWWVFHQFQGEESILMTQKDGHVSIKTFPEGRSSELDA